ncbi:MAG: PQQ-dependent sugar dehydrogenase [Planctomycetes bacterium]|nr:PQQ-dependent sugar dehydrogenase [Planctomycetota bacterium]
MIKSMLRVSAIGVFVVALFGCSSGGSDGGSSGNGGTQPLPLPASVEMVATGFNVQTVASSLAVPAKMAAAPDGRIFFNELKTGNIRVIDASGNLVAAPFATVADIATSSEQGLLGICLDNDFATNGFVYVQACINGAGVQRIIRFTATGNTGGSETILIDNLPMAVIHNAGALKMSSDGKLFVTIGDINDPNADDTNVAQVDGQLAGRILRYNADGSIPNDNPNPASPEYARGLRNPFGLALHPTENAIFATENGPDNNDELNFVQAGKNFAWPMLPAGFPGGDVGYTARTWPTVIVPTGITWYTHGAFGNGFNNNLFFGSYDEEVIWRFPMSGPVLADIDEEVEFLRFHQDGTNNKPLDVIQAADGSLLVSTFTSIYRITKQ